MKKHKTKILIFGLVVITMLGAGLFFTAEAYASSIYVFPTSETKIVGNTFDISVSVSASGSKICAVEGKLILNDLICNSITMADGLMAQSSPTCSNPYFLIGIPGCTTADSKTLFTVNVKANAVGSATASLTGVDIIGEGNSLSSNSSGGNYKINALSVPQKVETEVKNIQATPKVSSTPASTTETTTEEQQGTQEPQETNDQPSVTQTEELSQTGFLATIASAPLNMKIIVSLIIIVLIVLTVLWFMGRLKFRKKNIIK